MAQAILKNAGTQLLGVGIANQPLCLGLGNMAGARYVSVVRNSGNPYQWQFVFLASLGNTTKYNIGTQDGQAWWTVPANDPLPNCVSVAPGPQSRASTIVYNYMTQTLYPADPPGGFLAPMGSSSGFYFSTEANASSPVDFYATS
jgi:hypothetical protein